MIEKYTGGAEVPQIFLTLIAPMIYAHSILCNDSFVYIIGKCAHNLSYAFAILFPLDDKTDSKLKNKKQKCKKKKRTFKIIVSMNVFVESAVLVFDSIYQSGFFRLERLKIKLYEQTI